VGGPPRKVFDTDSEVRRLTTRARDLGIENRLHMIGQVPRREMPALFRSAEVVVCAPWYEPFGIVPVEAMACGTPVVASAVGGMLDTVVDRVTGRLVPARNPRLLGDVVGALLDDLSLCRQYGEAGPRRAVERYSWDRVAEDTAQVYRSVAVPRVHSVASA
jgi:D-inositol-3-phosphate glycosyltransferase